MKIGPEVAKVNTGTAGLKSRPLVGPRFDAPWGRADQRPLSAHITLVFGALIRIPIEAVNNFKQVLHLSAAAAEDHDVVGISVVGHMGVGSNLNTWVIFKSLARNPVDYVIEDSKGKSKSLSNCTHHCKLED